MSTLAEIASAVETLPPREQRDLFDFLATKLESQSTGTVAFPDLKALLLAMPDIGDETDFAGLPVMVANPFAERASG